MGGRWPHIQMQIGPVVEQGACSEGPILGGGRTSEDRRSAQRSVFDEQSP
jgi:hypothetical protein